MDQTRFDQSMARISQALKRTELAVEALATRPRSPAAGRDEQLRKRVAAAIGELDQLIKGIQR